MNKKLYLGVLGGVILLLIIFSFIGGSLESFTLCEMIFWIILFFEIVYIIEQITKPVNNNIMRFIYTQFSLILVLILPILKTTCQFKIITSLIIFVILWIICNKKITYKN